MREETKEIITTLGYAVMWMIFVIGVASVITGIALAIDGDSGSPHPSTSVHECEGR